MIPKTIKETLLMGLSALEAIEEPDDILEAEGEVADIGNAIKYLETH